MNKPSPFNYPLFLAALVTLYTGAACIPWYWTALWGFVVVVFAGGYVNGLPPDQKFPWFTTLLLPWLIYASFHDQGLTRASDFGVCATWALLLCDWGYGKWKKN